MQELYSEQYRTHLIEVLVLLPVDGISMEGKQKPGEPWPVVCVDMVELVDAPRDSIEAMIAYARRHVDSDKAESAICCTYSK